MLFVSELAIIVAIRIQANLISHSMLGNQYLSSIVVLECVKGKHLELIKPKEALNRIFDRFLNNLKSISLILKMLSMFHIAL